MKRKQAAILLAAIIALAAAAAAANAQAQPADIVFYGEHIITMEAEAEAQAAPPRAVAVRGASIVAVGAREQVAAHQGPETRVVQLGARALLPGFIDAHGHISLVMRTLGFVNLSPPPVGPVQNISDLQRELSKRLAEKPPPQGEWLIGYGYDDSLLAEGRHPQRADLDAVSTKRPIALLHVSGHLAALNSAALKAAGITAESADPPGGVIRRGPNGAPNGVLEESALHTALYPQFARAAKGADYAAQLQRALLLHARYGITTVQDGAASAPDVAALRAAAAAAPLPLDVVAYPVVTADAPAPAPAQTGFSREYRGGFRVGGVKFLLDGSPQGRTAWLTRPYTEAPPGKPADYVAYPVYPPRKYAREAARYIRAGIPILAHANGDAAIDALIAGVAAAAEGGALPDHRTVAIHAQLMRADQLPEVARLGIVPSYFAAHPFFWGDWHRRSFGDARALHISPLRATGARGIAYTIHNDAPIVPPDIMRLLWVAVNRETRSGFVLGEEQRATVMEALAAVTRNAARQYFEEELKGTITAGKQADLVVLEADPRAVPPTQLAEVKVVETFARGQSVYRAP